MAVWAGNDDGPGACKSSSFKWRTPGLLAPLAGGRVLWRWHYGDSEVDSALETTGFRVVQVAERRCRCFRAGQCCSWEEVVVSGYSGKG